MKERCISLLCHPGSAVTQVFLQWYVMHTPSCASRPWQQQQEGKGVHVPTWTVFSPFVHRSCHARDSLFLRHLARLPWQAGVPGSSSSVNHWWLYWSVCLAALVAEQCLPLITAVLPNEKNPGWAQRSGMVKYLVHQTLFHSNSGDVDGWSLPWAALTQWTFAVLCLCSSLSCDWPAREQLPRDILEILEGLYKQHSAVPTGLHTGETVVWKE